MGVCRGRTPTQASRTPTSCPSVRQNPDGEDGTHTDRDTVPRSSGGQERSTLGGGRGGGDQKKKKWASIAHVQETNSRDNCGAEWSPGDSSLSETIMPFALK